MEHSLSGAEIDASSERPNGIRYSFTLHDVDGARLLGFDNAHGVPRRHEYEHRHRFRKPNEILAYEFRGADDAQTDR